MQNHLLGWTNDPAVVDSHKLQPLYCDQYIRALENALNDAHDSVMGFFKEVGWELTATLKTDIQTPAMVRERLGVLPQSDGYNADATVKGVGLRGLEGLEGHVDEASDMRPVKTGPGMGLRGLESLGYVIDEDGKGNMRIVGDSFIKAQAQKAFEEMASGVADRMPEHLPKALTMEAERAEFSWVQGRPIRRSDIVSIDGRPFTGRVQVIIFLRNMETIQVSFYVTPEGLDINTIADEEQVTAAVGLIWDQIYDQA